MRGTKLIGGAVLMAGTAAHGAFITRDAPVRFDQAGSVRVELVGAWAGASGDIYYLGSTTGDTWTPAPDTGTPGLGTRLFYSKSTPGQSVELGEFAAGSTLHFAYEVTHGVGDLVLQGDVMRSDRNTDSIQFGWDEEKSDALSLRLGVEDIRDPKRSDWDYRDAVFDVVITPARGDVPAPGAVSLFALAGATGIRRRRR